MLTATPAYRLALPQTHKREFTFAAYTPDTGELLTPVGGVPIGGGQVTAQLASRVTRSASWTCSDEWFPVADTDPLSPYQSIVKISAGIGYPTGEREVFEVFTGRVYSANRSENGQVTFRADDLAAEVLVHDFEAPLRARKNGSCLAEMHRLILDGWQWATFGTDTATDAKMPELAWDDDRGKALDDLAAVMGARWYTLGNGKFVVRSNTYTDLTPVIQLIDGETGTLTGATTSVTADGAYNSVVVTSERPDGGNPLVAIERNVNSLSAARYGGRFGKRVKKVRAQSALTLGDAQNLARATLAAATSLTRQWDVNCVPDYTLEPADVIGLQWRGIVDTQVIDSITYPLGATGAMRISTRTALSSAATL